MRSHAPQPGRRPRLAASRAVPGRARNRPLRPAGCCGRAKPTGPALRGAVEPAVGRELAGRRGPCCWGMIPPASRRCGRRSPKYLGPRRRGVRRTAEHVVIVSGIRQALAIAARLLLDVGDPAGSENPGYRVCADRWWRRGQAGAVEVDSEGFVPAGRSTAGAATAADLHRAVAPVSPGHDHERGAAAGAVEHARQVNA